MELRYGLHGNCPECDRVSRFYRLRQRLAYSCEFCGHHIYPCSGTPFDHTRTPLRLWFYAIYLFTTTNGGVSARELQRQLGVTYKTAWRMGREIRKYISDTDHDSGNHDRGTAAPATTRRNISTYGTGALAKQRSVFQILCHRLRRRLQLCAGQYQVAAVA